MSFEISVDVEISIILEIQIQVFQNFWTPQNRGFSKIYLHCRSNFETPLFWEVQKFWKPPIWGGPILKNWNLNFEYDRKLDVDRNFERNFNSLKILKRASWKGYVSANFWKGSTFFSRELHFFRGGRQIFDFSEQIQGFFEARNFLSISKFLHWIWES